MNISVSEITRRKEYVVIKNETGKIVAFYRVTPDLAGVKWVRHVHVEPDYRGRGLAKAMLRCLPPDETYIAAISAYNDVSIRLFKSVGFKFIGEGVHRGLKFKYFFKPGFNQNCRIRS